MSCPHCKYEYSFFFDVQFHAKDCPEAPKWPEKFAVATKVPQAAKESKAVTLASVLPNNCFII